MFIIGAGRRPAAGRGQRGAGHAGHRHRLQRHRARPPHHSRGRQLFNSGTINGTRVAIQLTKFCARVSAPVCVPEFGPKYSIKKVTKIAVHTCVLFKK